MSSSTAETREALATRVEVSDDTLSVELSDGRTISAPLDDHFVSPSPLTRSRIRQNAGATTRILANAATFYWQGTYETVI
jgi:hypothetical protein